MKRQNLIHIVIGIACIGLFPNAHAVVPPPDGGYPNFTTAEGQNALFSLTTGAANTAVGWFSLKSVTTGSFNTGLGAGTLVLNTGDANTATGVAALLLNTTGQRNTANGTAALVNNSTGDDNTAVGAFALNRNTADANTAVGADALSNSTTADFNAAVGFGSLQNLDTGSNNTAIGTSTLFNSTSSLGNTAVGSNALFLSSTDDHNTAIGFNALFALDGGADNVALGASAGQALQTGDGNVYIGADMQGVVSETNHTYIRNINTTSVSGGGTDTVTINLTTGLVGHLSSSRRYKEDIKPMDRASEALYQLKPVSYRYTKEIDSTQSPAFGLIAEEVADVNSALVACNSKGKPESVHYEMVNAMLLNEFLKEHKTVQALKSTVLGQQSIIVQQRESFERRLAEQEKQIKALTDAVEKVNAQLEMNNNTPRVAANEP
jgi:hypothetical protein